MTFSFLLQGILLYTLPLIFMSIAYYFIVKTLWRRNNIPNAQVLSVPTSLGQESQCVKCSFLIQKLTILEKLENRSIFISVTKLTFFSGKKFEIFEFSRLNWSKIVISCFYSANFRSKFNFWP